MPEYKEKFPRPESPDVEDFLIGYAHVMLLWRTVESSAYDLFIKLLECRDERTSAIIFHNATHFSRQLGIMEDIAEFRFRENEQFLQHAKTVLSKLRTANKDRNRLVHLSVTTIGAKIGDNEKASLMLRTNPTEIRKDALLRHRPVTNKVLEAIIFTFVEVMIETRKLFLQDWPPSPSPDKESEPDHEPSNE